MRLAYLLNLLLILLRCYCCFPLPWEAGRGHCCLYPCLIYYPSCQPYTSVWPRLFLMNDSQADRRRCPYKRVCIRCERECLTAVLSVPVLPLNSNPTHTCIYTLSVFPQSGIGDQGMSACLHKTVKSLGLLITDFLISKPFMLIHR